MLTHSAAVTLYLAYVGFADGMSSDTVVADGRPARDPDDTVGSGISKRQGEENVED